MIVRLTDGSHVNIEELTRQDDMTRVMDDLQEQVNVLDAAVQMMGAEAFAAKKFKMSRDYYQNKYLVKHYRQAIQILKRGLSDKKVLRHEKRRQVFENAFIAVAKQKLTGEVFDAIYVEAKRILDEQSLMTQQEEAL